jgi:hypothetical protein
MGFHKRWISKENLLNRYKNGGLESVKLYFRADALMVTDEFSSNILKLLNIKDDESAIKLLESEIL